MKKNTNTIMKYLLTSVAALVLLSSIPSSVSAATVYLEASRNTLSVGDTAIITVKINADGAVLNTVEGDVALKSSALNLAVQEFSLANSSFGLWPRTPSLSKDAHTVSFVGGVPGGFSIEGATLFKIIVEAREKGTVTLSPQNIAVYANDGKGTKLPVQVKDLVINVVAKKTGTPVNNEWQGIVSQDILPPEDFFVVLGQDNSLFTGKKFAFFSAIDNQSGIDHYDVSENGGTAVRSGSTYVLQDQKDTVKLNVIAYDKAGNKKSALYPSQTTQTGAKINWTYIIALVVLVTIIIMVYKKMKKSKINNSNTSSGSNSPTDVPNNIQK